MGMRPRHLFLACLVMLQAIASSQVVLNQIDTFQDGTTQSWGGGSSPVNVPTGGPLGAGDKYLQISATGSSLATFNNVRWTGNFPAAGVNRIEADLRNTGANPLVIRLVLFGGSGDRWSSNTSFSLPTGGAWTHVAYNLDASNFTHTIGGGTFAATVTVMDRIMFRHEPTITSGGTAVTGQLGIDNVAGYAQVTTFSPSAFSIISGFPGSGGVSDLGASDNSYLFVRQNAIRSRQDPAVQIEASSTAPPGSFSSLQFTLESSTTASPASSVTQKIELFSYSTNGWVLVDSRACSATDATATITLNSGVDQFVDPATHAIKARLSYFDPGTLLTRSWGVNFDFIQWVLTR